MEQTYTSSEETNDPREFMDSLPDYLAEAVKKIGPEPVSAGQLAGFLNSFFGLSLNLPKEDISGEPASVRKPVLEWLMETEPLFIPFTPEINKMKP